MIETLLQLVRHVTGDAQLRWLKADAGPHTLRFLKLAPTSARPTALVKFMNTATLIPDCRSQVACADESKNQSGQTLHFETVTRTQL